MKDLKALASGNYVLRLPLRTEVHGRSMGIDLDVGPDEITDWSLALALLLLQEVSSIVVTQREHDAGQAAFTLWIRLATEPTDCQARPVSQGMILYIDPDLIRDLLHHDCLRFFHADRPKEWDMGCDIVGSTELRSLGIQFNLVRPRTESFRRKRRK